MSEVKGRYQFGRPYVRPAGEPLKHDACSNRPNATPAIAIEIWF